MNESKDKLKVLFLCTGNACRSQIAEGWARHLKSDVIDAYSAGVEPASSISHRAVEVMTEAGVDISNQFPKHVDSLADIDFDYVVTVCDYARDQCPTFSRPAGRLHRLFSDPSFMEAPEEEIMAEFRKLRDDIKAFIEEMPQILEREAQ